MLCSSLKTVIGLCIYQRGSMLIEAWKQVRVFVSFLYHEFAIATDEN